MDLKNPVRVFFDRGISAYIAVTLAEWGGRWYYFASRYYDQGNRLLIKSFLTKGDTYIDIGANIGIHSLAASRVVGANGLVLAIEPDPEAFAYLQSHLVINRIKNVLPMNIGLSDKTEILELSRSGEHTGTSTFRLVPGSKHSTKVSVVVGDEVLDTSILRGKVLVKIDTEGFEHRVLKGLKKLLTYRHIALVAEVTDKWLQEIGSSAEELYHELFALGFKAYHVKVTYSWFRPVLKLVPLTAPPIEQHDALFARDGFVFPQDNKTRSNSARVAGDCAARW